MNDPARFLLATSCGLVLAAAVHIAIILGAPRMAEHDAFSRLRDTIATGQMMLVSAPGGTNTWLPRPDPAAAVAACAFDLAEGPVRISAKVADLLQSISLHSRGGGAFYAVTDRAAVRRALDLVVMTRRQLDEALAAEDEDNPSRDVRILSPTREGLVIVRVVAPFPSLRPQAEEAAKAVSCATEVGDEEEGSPD